MVDRGAIYGSSADEKVNLASEVDVDVVICL